MWTPKLRLDSRNDFRCIRSILATCVCTNGQNTYWCCIQPMLTLISIHNLDSAAQVTIQLRGRLQRVGKICVRAQCSNCSYISKKVSKVSRDKLKVNHLSTKFPNFYGTRSPLPCFKQPTSCHPAFITHI
jgi:hypothetical protein